VANFRPKVGKDLISEDKAFVWMRTAPLAALSPKIALAASGWRTVIDSIYHAGDIVILQGVFLVETAWFFDSIHDPR